MPYRNGKPKAVYWFASKDEAGYHRQVIQKEMLPIML